MRRDIEVNTSTNDMILTDTNKLKAYPFKWVYEGDLEVSGEITIPNTLDVSVLHNEGVRVEIPYTPIYKPIRIRIVRQYDDKTFVPIINPVNGTEWFNIYTCLWNQQKSKQICASQLIMVNYDHYIIQLNNTEGVGYIWSAVCSDAVNIVANIQNRNLLLKCIPTNNYRYPTTGVGLVRFLHANLKQTELAKILHDEFEADKVMVKSAAFDSFTGDIDLDLDFSRANGNL